MITAEDTYDVAGKILEIPLDAIHPANDNVRSELGDLDGLAASIREVGVLQAIRVVPNGSGDTFTILTGHRRHAAAQVAGLLTIPAVVTTKPDDAKRVMAMLIENVQRRDISALDEAHAFARLEEEFDLDQPAIASRVGCSQSHVSKRLSLLALPDRAKEMLAAGDLTIGDAIELAKLVAHPDILNELLDGWKSLPVDERRWALEEAVDDAKREDARNAKVAELVAKGLTVIDDTKGSARVANASEYISTGPVVRFDPKTLKKHAKEPCHAVHVNDNANTFDYCTDPKRHAEKGKSALKAIVEPKPDSRAARNTESDQRLDEIKAHRTAFIREVVRDRKIDRANITTRVLAHVALDGYAGIHEKRAKTLGLDLEGRDANQALADYVAGGTEPMLRACLAALLDGAESPYCDDTELLEQLGYEPTEYEGAQRAEREDRRARYEAAEPCWEILERIEQRAVELTGDNPAQERVDVLVDELEQKDGVTVERAGEIQAEFDVIFAELNDLAPGDVVNADDEGHTIERADEDDEPCPFPHCARGVDHDGDHAIVLTDYVKAENECSATERFARDALVRLDGTAADEDLDAIQRELYAGVDKERAAEIYEILLARIAALDETDADDLDEPDPPALTGYAEPEAGSAHEDRCRDHIALLPADHPEVIELQQELYAGISTVRATRVLKDLKRIAAELANA